MFQAQFLEKIETQIMSNKFLYENRDIYEMKWKNIV